LIVHNAKVLTVDVNFRVAEAAAIRDGVFLSVGTDAEVLRLRGPNTRVLDLQGKTVIPGFVATDADNDLVAGNLYKETLVGGKIFGTMKIESKADILREIASRVRSRPPGEMVFFRLLEESQDALKLTRADLDPISPRNPIAASVTSSDMIVNTLMLEKVIERMPMGEKHPGIIKDANGRPNGQIYGQATGVVGWDLRPWPKIDDAMVEEQKQMFRDLNAKGITSMVAHTQGFSLSVVNVLWHRNELTMRLFAAHDFIRQNPYAEAYLRRLGNLVDFGLGDMVRILGAGLASADGNADIGSALTLDPKLRSGGYAFAPEGENKWIGYGAHKDRWGDNNTVPKELTEWANVQAAVKYGWNTAGIHNVGDQATQLWLDSIEDALKQPDIALRPQWRPFGLDHNMFWNPKQDDQIKRLDVRRGLGKVWQNPAMAVELYGDRIHDVQPVPELIQKGFQVHIEGTDPFEELQQYITRKDEQGRVWGPDHAVDRPTALRMKTIWAARYIAEDKNLGSIERGKKGDLVVLGADYLTVPEDQIERIPIEMTIVDGKIVYERR
ncbi:MAG: Amidohydro 3 protein, partial [Acidobacteria bacterium]|nr:Amidohydro 3 protein [Acidobacteriota bacterium]